MTDKQTQDTAHRLREGYDHARHAASDAYASSRDKMGDAARRAADGLESNPLGLLVGGAAVGALIGALVPRSDREKALLAPAGRKLNESARAAIQAAREAGYAELDQRGLTRDAARDQAKGVVRGFGKALNSAGTAAAEAARGKATDTAGA